VIYSNGAGWLHRLHPLTKLVGALLLLLAAFLLPRLYTPVALFCLVLLLATSAGVGNALFRAVFRILLPIIISLFIIQGLLFPPAGGAPLPIGPFTLRTTGLEFAFLTSTRLLTATAAIFLVLQTTHPGDLVFALTERGLPRSIGYILLVSLQIVPTMSARATAILEAQRSRGLETERGLLRARALVPLLGPLVVGALVDVEQRAMALESRAYNAPGPKTSLRQLTDTGPQRIARWLLLALSLGLVAGRIWFWA
jgi:energy-coupling factor transport system permease protein